MVETNKQKYNLKYNKGKDVSNSKQKITRQTGVSKRILDQVFDRGVGAFKTNRSAVRPQVKSAEQWAYARIYSFVMGGRTQKTADKDLWVKHLENVTRKANKKK
jgi:hypothetical protein